MKPNAIIPITFLLLLITTSCEQKKKTGWVRTQDSPSIAVKNEEQSRWIATTRNLADTLYNVGYYLEASKQYESLLKYVHNDGELYYKMAYCKARFGEFEESNADYFKAINLGYKQSSSYYNVGVSYLPDNDSLAVFYLEKALSVDSEYIKARTLLDIVKECRRKGEKFDLSKMGFQ